MAELLVTHTSGDGFVVTDPDGPVELARYVYRPREVQYESPRPYLHPIRTRAGRLVTVFRPWDHVWHKGLTLALPNVGAHNFWGGVTYTRTGSYQKLDNNGSQDHETVVDAGPDRFVHDPVWHSQPEATGGSAVSLIRERRTIGVAATADDAWVLRWESRLTNVSGDLIPIGSPTTEGRENAGYGGLFWRGPRSFTTGFMATEDGTTGEAVRGRRGAWAGFSGKHDEIDAESSVVLVDLTEDQGVDTKWFARSDPFACLNPAPFFDRVREFLPGETITLRYAAVIADGGSDADRMGALAASVAQPMAVR